MKGEKGKKWRCREGRVEGEWGLKGRMKGGKGRAEGEREGE